MRDRVLASVALAASILCSGQATASDDFHPLPPPDPEVYLDRSGFNELLSNQILMGSQIGLALTTGLFSDPVRQASGSILGLGAGVVLPIVLTRGRPVPSGDVLYINTLQWAGFFDGLLLFTLLQSVRPSDTDLYRGSMLSMAGGSLLGLGAALLTKDSLQLMPGQAAAMGTAYWFGLFTSGALSLVLELDSVEAVLGSMLAFSNGGLLAAFLLRDQFRVNRSRIVWTSIGASVGAMIGAGLSFLLGGLDASMNFMAGATLVGFWGGAIVTYRYLVPPDSFRNRANLQSNALLGIDGRGRVSFGLPLPSLTILPAGSAAERSKVAATVGILEWRAP